MHQVLLALIQQHPLFAPQGVMQKGGLHVMRSLQSLTSQTTARQVLRLRQQHCGDYRVLAISRHRCFPWD